MYISYVHGKCLGNEQFSKRLLRTPAYMASLKMNNKLLEKWQDKKQQPWVSRHDNLWDGNMGKLMVYKS